jgi:pyruvate/2-oxoglutarate dehydrogenase complex dihydrolipoamide dehydrogenase (E3) component
VGCGGQRKSNYLNLVCPAGGVRVYKSTFTPLIHGIAAHKPMTLMKVVCTGCEQPVVGLHIVGHGMD